MTRYLSSGLSSGFSHALSRASSVFGNKTPTVLKSPVGRWGLDYCERANTKIDFANIDNSSDTTTMIRKRTRKTKKLDEYYRPFVV